ncbi:glycine cleavage system protein GcvH [Nitrolancea hollandica]|uniref:Glycine cleavage system H protein n=1 Tax=Nitrolancea hollandica Lb TaxID=1129897 RepID=I4EF26_9BACT|nr:glycine cleavage system protein GcvH [Nitrolancea hollandica]CCF83288.1 Glycine cleavage system H-protein [Nitrolancea hollandica Lb]
MVNVPEGLRYTKTHEWVNVEDGVATMGATDYAQSELGDITYIELPEPGTEVTQTEPMGVIESVKAASDVYAAVSGEVTEINQDVVDAPETVNSSPYDAWFVRIRMSNPEELDNLMNAEDYETYVAEQEGGH